jgi:hypothetical protein
VFSVCGLNEIRTSIVIIHDEVGKTRVISGFGIIS